MNAFLRVIGGSTLVFAIIDKPLVKEDSFADVKIKTANVVPSGNKTDGLQAIFPLCQYRAA